MATIADYSEQEMLALPEQEFAAVIRETAEQLYDFARSEGTRLSEANTRRRPDLRLVAASDSNDDNERAQLLAALEETIAAPLRSRRRRLGLGDAE